MAGLLLYNFVSKVSNAAATQISSFQQNQRENENNDEDNRKADELLTNTTKEEKKHKKRKSKKKKRDNKKKTRHHTHHADEEEIVTNDEQDLQRNVPSHLDLNYVTNHIMAMSPPPASSLLDHPETQTATKTTTTVPHHESSTGEQTTTTREKAFSFQDTIIINLTDQNFNFHNTNNSNYSLPLSKSNHEYSPPVILNVGWESPGFKKLRNRTPSIHFILKVCRALSYFSNNNNNKAATKQKNRIRMAFYCHNGRTRTGIVVACYLKYLGLVQTCMDGFYLFCQKRCSISSPDVVNDQIPPSLKLFFKNMNDAIELNILMSATTNNNSIISITSREHHDSRDDCSPEETTELKDKKAIQSNNNLFGTNSPLILRAITLQGVPVEDMPRIDVWDLSTTPSSSSSNKNKAKYYSPQDRLVYSSHPLPSLHEEEGEDEKTHQTQTQWVEDEGFFRVNKPVCGDFVLMCRFGGIHSSDTQDSSKLLFRYANNTAFLSRIKGIYEIPLHKMDVMKLYSESFDQEDFLVTLMFEEECSSTTNNKNTGEKGNNINIPSSSSTTSALEQDKESWSFMLQSMKYKWPSEMVEYYESLMSPDSTTVSNSTTTTTTTDMIQKHVLQLMSMEYMYIDSNDRDIVRGATHSHSSEAEKVTNTELVKFEQSTSKSTDDSSKQGQEGLPPSPSVDESPNNNDPSPVSTVSTATSETSSIIHHNSRVVNHQEIQSFISTLDYINFGVDFSDISSHHHHHHHRNTSSDSTIASTNSALVNHNLFSVPISKTPSSAAFITKPSILNMPSTRDVINGFHKDDLHRNYELLITEKLEQTQQFGMNLLDGVQSRYMEKQDIRRNNHDHKKHKKKKARGVIDRGKDVFDVVLDESKYHLSHFMEHQKMKRQRQKYNNKSHYSSLTTHPKLPLSGRHNHNDEENNMIGKTLRNGIQQFIIGKNQHEEEQNNIIDTNDVVENDNHYLPYSTSNELSSMIHAQDIQTLQEEAHLWGHNDDYDNFEGEVDNNGFAEFYHYETEVDHPVSNFTGSAPGPSTSSGSGIIASTSVVNQATNGLAGFYHHEAAVDYPVSNFTGSDFVPGTSTGSGSGSGMIASTSVVNQASQVNQITGGGTIVNHHHQQQQQQQQQQHEIMTGPIPDLSGIVSAGEMLKPVQTQQEMGNGSIAIHSTLGVSNTPSMSEATPTQRANIASTPIADVPVEKTLSSPAEPSNNTHVPISELPLKEHPEYAKYFKMLKVGLPLEAVKHALKKDGKDPSIIDLDQDKSLESQITITTNKLQGSDEKSPPPNGNSEVEPPLKEHPDYIKYFKMLKVGLPLEAVKHAMIRDGKDPNIMDLNPDESIASQQKQNKSSAPSDSDAGVPLKEDPEYQKYFKMLKVGLPLDAVKHAMIRDGLDETIMDLDHSKSLKSQRGQKTNTAEEVDTGIPLKEDPEYQKYFKMLKVGLPLEAVKHAMIRDGLDETIMDLDHSKSLKSQRGQKTNTAEEVDTGIPLKEDPEYQKYFKMLKVGLPLEAVKHAMIREGLDETIMDLDHSKSVEFQRRPKNNASEEVDTGIPLKDDPEYQKYFKMLKVGLPLEAVKHAMIREGLDETIMDLDHNMSVEFQRRPKNNASEEVDTGIPLKDDPEYQKYFKMLKVGLPLEAVKHAMIKDGLDETIMDLDHNKSVEFQRRQKDDEVEDVDTGIPLKDDPEYKKYFKMLKVGLPLEAVKHAMIKDGLDETIMDLDHNKSVEFQRRQKEKGADEVDTGVPLKEDPEYQKYFKMLKIGLPLDAVKHAMIRDGLDETIMDLDHNKSLEFQRRKKKKSTKVKKKEPPKPKIKRKRIYWTTIEESAIGEDSIWSMVQTLIPPMEQLEYDTKEFENLFTETVGAKKMKDTGLGSAGNKIKEKKAFQVIDAKRAQNGGIILSRIKISFLEIAEQINSMTAKDFDEIQLKNLQEFLATEEEHGNLIMFMKKGLYEDLCPTEKYMYDMIQNCSNPKAKLECLIYYRRFASRMDGITTSLNDMNNGCKEVRESLKLRKIIAMTLSLGNQINTGSNSGAPGFSLNTLVELHNAKAFDKKTTVLQYLVSLIKKNDASLLEFKKELPSIDLAEKVMIEALTSELNQLVAEFDEVKGTVEKETEQRKSEEASPDNTNEEEAKSSEEAKDDENDESKNNENDQAEDEEKSVSSAPSESKQMHPMELFVEQAQSDLNEITEEIDQTTQNYLKALRYFGESDKTPSSDFFGVIKKFISQFDEALALVNRLDAVKAKEEKRAAAAAAKRAKALASAKKNEEETNDSEQKPDETTDKIQDTSKKEKKKQPPGGIAAATAVAALMRKRTENAPPNGIGALAAAAARKKSKETSPSKTALPPGGIGALAAAAAKKKNEEGTASKPALPPGGIGALAAAAAKKKSEKGTPPKPALPPGGIGALAAAAAKKKNEEGTASKPALPPGGIGALAAAAARKKTGDGTPPKPALPPGGIGALAAAAAKKKSEKGTPPKPALPPGGIGALAAAAAKKKSEEGSASKSTLPPGGIGALAAAAAKKKNEEGSASKPALPPGGIGALAAAAARKKSEKGTPPKPALPPGGIGALAAAAARKKTGDGTPPKPSLPPGGIGALAAAAARKKSDEGSTSTKPPLPSGGIAALAAAAARKKNNSSSQDGSMDVDSAYLQNNIGNITVRRGPKAAFSDDELSCLSDDMSQLAEMRGVDSRMDLSDRAQFLGKKTSINSSVNIKSLEELPKQGGTAAAAASYLERRTSVGDGSSSKMVGDLDSLTDGIIQSASEQLLNQKQTQFESKEKLELAATELRVSVQNAAENFGKIEEELPESLKEKPLSVLERTSSYAAAAAGKKEEKKISAIEAAKSAFETKKKPKAEGRVAAAIAEKNLKEKRKKFTKQVGLQRSSFGAAGKATSVKNLPSSPGRKAAAGLVAKHAQNVNSSTNSQRRKVIGTPPNVRGKKV